MKISRSFAAACLLAAALPGQAAAATYTVQGMPGAVTSLTIALPGARRIVADHMLANPALVASEQATFAAGAAAKGSCAWASAARPFTRLRGYAPGGKLAWTWDLAKERIGLRLLGGGLEDCASPDGRRLLVEIFARTDEDLAIGDLRQGFAVISIAPPPGFVRQPRTRAEAFGNPRTTAPIGWRTDRKATLRYETGVRDDATTVEADFSQPPKH